MSYHSRNQLSNARPVRRNDITASTNSALTSAAIGSGIFLVYVVNDTGVTAYVRPVQSGGTVSASNGLPILTGMGYHIAVRPGEYVAGILASGSGTIMITEMTV